MGYRKIQNLYRNKDILMFKECYALEKIHGTSAHIRFQFDESKWTTEVYSGGIKHSAFEAMLNERFGLEATRENFLKYIEDWPGIRRMTIYGEAYGGKCQKMSETYGPLNFVTFEVNVDGHWLDVPTAERITKELGLPFVHYEKGPATIDWLNEQRKKPSTQAIRNGMGDDKESEGIVIRPLIELRKNNGERIMAKHKNESFRETRRPRKVGEKLQKLSEANIVAREWVTPMRLQHVLDKLVAAGMQHDFSEIPNVCRAMVKDIEDESEGEIEWSKKVRKAIGKETVRLYKDLVSKEIYNA